MLGMPLPDRLDVRRPSGRRRKTGGMSGCGSADRPPERLFRRSVGGTGRGRAPPRRRLAAAIVRSRLALRGLGGRGSGPQSMRSRYCNPRRIPRGHCARLRRGTSIVCADSDPDDVRLRDRAVIPWAVDPDGDDDVDGMRLRSLARRSCVLPGRGLLCSAELVRARLRGVAAVSGSDAHDGDVRLGDRTVVPGAVDPHRDDHVGGRILRSHAVCGRRLVRRGGLGRNFDRRDEVVRSRGAGHGERIQRTDPGHQAETRSPTEMAQMGRGSRMHCFHARS